MTGWSIHIDGDTLTLCRPGRARMDVAVCATLAAPVRSRRRLARAIRQDIWRACRAARGFSPVVEVSHSAGTTTICAGGQIDGVRPGRIAETIGQVLEAPANRARWQGYAS